MDRVNGRPCYCSIGAGGTPCIDRKYCDALREIERLRAALERIATKPPVNEEYGNQGYDADEMQAMADAALREGVNCPDCDGTLEPHPEGCPNR